MNLRPWHDKENFPLRDQVPARILTTDIPYSSLEYEARCCAFFAATFKVLLDDLLRLLKHDSNQLDQAIRRWNNGMDVRTPKERNNFFERVDLEFKAVCRKSWHGRVHTDTNAGSCHDCKCYSRYPHKSTTDIDRN